jgi:DME family drug/metabolite transporter
MTYLAFTGADLSAAPLGWAGAAYLALFCTTMATLLWALGLEGVSATASATIMLVEVVTALVIAIVLLKETMSSAAMVGGAFVMLSIALVAGTNGGEKPSVKTA